VALRFGIKFRIAGAGLALGTQPVAKLALFLILARVAHQGSRLSAVRWAEEHADGVLLTL
jgi:hypothetical protein